MNVNVVNGRHLGHSSHTVVLTLESKAYCCLFENTLFSFVGYKSI